MGIRESILKYLGLKLNAFTQFLHSVNFYHEVIEDLEKTKAKAEKIYNEFKEKITSEDYLKTIDYYEQAALAENGRNYKEAISELSGAIQNFIANKFPPSLKGALHYVEDLRIELRDLISTYYDLEDLNKSVKVTPGIDEKKFAKASYKHKVSLLQISAGNLRDDIKDGDFSEVPSEENLFHKLSLIKTLGKLEVVLQEEIENIETNGMPKPHTYNLPEIVEPKVPEGPEDEGAPEGPKGQSDDAEETRQEVKEEIQEKE